MGSGRSSTSPAPAAGDAGAGEQAQLQFPAGLRVLVVDDDTTCLKILEKMLQKCHYDVTTCSCAVVALSMLREKKGGFDLVLSDVYMPDMDGFKLLELIGLEMGLPVIMMSVEDRNDVVMKGVNCGAVDYLIKPVRIEALKNIWQHVVRKRRNEMGLEQVGSAEENDKQKRPLDEADNASSANEGNWKNVKRKKDEKEEEDEAEDRDDSSTSKKQRVVWSVDLHQQFVAAVNQLGVDKAVPKKILELMNVPGLTRENVASHLQKYRLYLRRVSGPQHPGRLDTQFQGASDATYAPNGLVNGYGLQGLPISSQLAPHNHINLPAGPRQVDQMSCFGTNQQIPNTSRMIAPGQQWTNDRQMNMITGSSSNLEPWQSPKLLQSYGNIGKQTSSGASGFLNSLSSLTTGSSLNGGAIIGRQRNPLVMQMSQQAQQFSMSRQQNQLSIDAPKQAPVRGQILNGVAGENDPRLASNLSQQILSNEIPNNVYGREVIANADASLPGGGFLANNFDQVPQALYPDLQSCFANESSVNSYPLVSSIGTPDLTTTGMFRESVVPVNGSLDVLEGAKEFNSSYDIFGDLHQKKKQDWKLQNVNAYEAPRQSNGMDYGSSIPTHQDLLAAIKDRNTCTVSKEIFSIRTETEHRKVECIAQRNSTVLVENSYRVSSDGLPDTSSRDMIFADNGIRNELMNVFSKQQEGQVEPDFNLDGYSLDDIFV